MEEEGSKSPSKPSGLDGNWGDALLSSLPKTRPPPKQGFLPRRSPRSTKGQLTTVPFKKTPYSVWETSLKERSSTKPPIKPRDLEKMEKEVEKAIEGKSPEESKKILNMAEEIVENEDDPLTKLLSELRLGGRTRRRKNKRNHKNKRKTKRSSY
jgi:hypothetical protein